MANPKAIRTSEPSGAPRSCVEDYQEVLSKAQEQVELAREMSKTARNMRNIALLMRKYSRLVLP
jgi:hypothetical protein